MKKEELTALGLNEEQANAVFAMAGRDVEKYKKQVSDLETEKTDLQGRLTKADEAIAKFDGINPDELKGEVEKYKKQAADAEADFKKQLQARDQKAWVGAQLDKYGVKSGFARRQLEADAMADGSGLSWKDGAFFGFDDFMKAAKEKDSGLYMTDEEKKAAEEAEKKKQRAPQIVGPTGKTEPGGEAYVPPRIF